MSEQQEQQRKPPTDLSNRLAFSIPEVVEVAQVGRSTIYEEIKVGRLIARKARGRTIILRKDLESWLAALLPVSGVGDGPSPKTA